MYLKQLMAGLLTTTLAAGTLSAAENKEFEYPELLVSPSASERLTGEAKAENRNRWSAHWAIQASALATLMAGSMANGDPGKDAEQAAKKGEEPSSKGAAKAATYVGGFWLITTTAMSATYTPYQSGLAKLQGMAQGNKKDRLAYERYAEEALYAPSRVATVMKWAAFASNAGANAMVIQGAANTTTKTFGGLALVASTLPLLFEHQWNAVNRFQGEYKKRIYGPLSSLNLSLMPNGDSMAAVSSFSLEF
jgi:hypothetical protein